MLRVELTLCPFPPSSIPACLGAPSVEYVQNKYPGNLRNVYNEICDEVRREKENRRQARARRDRLDEEAAARRAEKKRVAAAPAL